MDWYYDYWTGSLNEASKSLVKSVAQYLRHYRKVKIGITNNPARRFSEHKRSGIKWDYLVVKYETTSVKFINKMEKTVVDYHFDYVENEIGGGGGPNGQGKQYLYVLLKK